MHKGVDTWPHEVNPSRKVLAIYYFELLCEGCQRQVHLTQIVVHDSVLVHEMHTIYQFAIVHVVFFWEDVVKKTRAKTIEIQQELPGLVPACELLSDVARGAVEGTR